MNRKELLNSYRIKRIKNRYYIQRKYKIGWLYVNNGQPSFDGIFMSIFIVGFISIFTMWYTYLSLAALGILCSFAIEFLTPVHKYDSINSAETRINILVDNRIREYNINRMGNEIINIGNNQNEVDQWVKDNLEV